ncbi:hypothetical protein G9A89_003646 [Geosiphon pyriformis]|nr:hypothetical protein G9A89_003646 [Geosiphon pyriformis]
MSPQQHFHALSNDFGNLFNSQKFSDIRITVGEAPNITTFRAHSQILAARLPYFTVAFSNKWVKRENNTIIFAKPNISTDIFEKIIRYIYNGEISLDEHGVPIILELLVVANELILENLIDHLEDYLIEYHAKDLEENFAILHKISYMHDSFKKLQNFRTEIAAMNPAIVFNSQDFTSLSENALSSILNRDDVNIEESKIWEKIVEWGVAKLDNNIQIKKVLSWTNENFNAFKESFEMLLPLIHFFNISSVDFYHKVKPFARILPGTLYEDFLHHYLVLGSHQKSVDGQPLHCSRLNIDSKLLRSYNIRQLDHWIQGKDKNTPFEDRLGNDFQLLLRSRAIVSVIKVKGTGQLIGDYNPQSWHSRDEFSEGKGSFIFSLGDGKAEYVQLSKFIGGYGPLCGPHTGPHFAGGSIFLFSNDFQNSPLCYCGKTKYYEYAIMPGSENLPVNFSFEEYEVFQIIKR